jgi:hypothetical protein
MAGTIVSDTIQNGAGATVPTTTVINGSAKAWVNFNGVGTVAIRASFNVSSVTRNATGFYTVNFTTAFADTSYCAVLGHNYVANGGGDSGISPQISSYTATPITTSYILLGMLYQGGGYDCDTVNVAIFR